MPDERLGTITLKSLSKLLSKRPSFHVFYSQPGLWALCAREQGHPTCWARWCKFLQQWNVGWGVGWWRLSCWQNRFGSWSLSRFSFSFALDEIPLGRPKRKKPKGKNSLGKRLTKNNIRDAELCLQYLRLQCIFLNIHTYMRLVSLDYFLLCIGVYMCSIPDCVHTCLESLPQNLVVSRFLFKR